MGRAKLFFGLKILARPAFAAKKLPGRPRLAKGFLYCEFSEFGV
jgi:hypothetical protein